MRLGRTVAGVSVAGAVLFGTVPAAQATSYRYWTYWTSSGDTWTFSAVGPASVVPADGAVEGWRFAVSEGVRGRGASPRIPVDQAFDQFCGPQSVTPGSKRVAVVFDFGDTTDAPPEQKPPASRGTCVVAPTAATGARILSQAAAVRTDRGLVCAIGGYPANECAPAITETPSPEPTSSPTSAANDPRADASSAPKQPAATAAPRSNSGPVAGAEPPRKDQSDVPAPTSSPVPVETERTAKASTQIPGVDAPTPSPDSASPAALDEAAAAVAPTFIEADATEPSSPRPWLPGLVTGLALVGLVSFVWFRRRRP